MAKFPKTIYVTREDDGSEDTYLSTHEEVPNVDEDTNIAIYQLSELAKIVVTREVKKQELKRPVR